VHDSRWSVSQLQAEVTVYFLFKLSVFKIVQNTTHSINKCRSGHLNWKLLQPQPETCDLKGPMPRVKLYMLKLNCYGNTAIY
jgi:hypothetical protein